jgi:hypothetical protein
MKEIIKAIFEALQTLDIKSTAGNVQTLTGVYNALNDLYQKAQAQEKPEEKEDDKE